MSTLSASRMRRLRSRVQVVFQDPHGSLNRRKSVSEIVAAPLSAHRSGSRTARAARVAELLDLVQLPSAMSGRRPRELFGGQAQRVAIARALALRPDFVVLDEAVSALDVSVRAQMLNLLRDLQRELGLTYLFVSHDLGVVRYISEDVGVMYRGRMVEVASREQLFATPQHPYTRLRLGIPGCCSARCRSPIQNSSAPECGCSAKWVRRPWPGMRGLPIPEPMPRRNRSATLRNRRSCVGVARYHWQACRLPLSRGDDMTIAAPVRLSDRLIMVVESFLSSPPQTLSEVSVACGMEPSTATRYLRQFAEHGWLERDDALRTYCLGVGLLEIGQAARTARPLRRTVLPDMRELLARFDETISLAVHRSGEIAIIEALESGRSIRRGASVGDHDDWFVSSLGKSILAHLPEQEVLDLLSTHRPVRRTPNTLVDPDSILADLAEIRSRGYALDDEEADIGLKCVGVPIRDHRGRFTHALSISGPVARIDAKLDEIAGALIAVAESVGRGNHGDSG